LISLWGKQGEGDARTLVITTLILSNTLLIFLNRGPNVSLKSKLKMMPSKIVTWILVISTLVLFAALYIPSMRSILNFSFMHPIDIAICLLATFLSIGMRELTLFILNKSNQ